MRDWEGDGVEIYFFVYKILVFLINFDFLWFFEIKKLFVFVYGMKNW